MPRTHSLARRSALLPVVLAGAAVLVAPATPTGAAVTTSGNLLTGSSAGFDTDLGGWSAVGPATVARSSSVRDTGTGSLAVTSTGRGQVGAVSPSVPAVPGAHYTGTASLQAGGTARPSTVVICFYDAAGSAIAGSDEWGQPVTDTAGTWHRPLPVVGIAPATATTLREFVLFSGVAAGETHYVDDVVLTVSTGTATPLVGPLATRGRQVVDANGVPVVLRGLHREGPQRAGSTPVTENEVQQAENWGANVIRVPLAENRWLPGDCSYDATYAQTIDQIVAWTTKRGMLALLDLHVNAITPCGPLAQQPMADAKAVTFWKQVAARYKSNRLVAFDLYNEPHDISDATWRNGGLVLWDGVVYQAAGMQQMYNAVRSTGATNLVFATGNAWGNWWPTTAPLTGSNIVYAAHAYTCPQRTPADGGPCMGADPYDPSVILDHFAGPGLVFPIVVTEFGWPDQHDGTYDRNVIDYAEAHGWGWVVFAWCGTTTGAFNLLKDVGATYQPQQAGMAVLVGLSRN